MTTRWEFWIDRGGTFTDCLGRDPNTGQIRVAKVLSDDLAPLTGIRSLLGLGPGEPIPPCDVRMGTTVATNALLERHGAHVGLLITRGFADLPIVRDQTRPQLFDLAAQRPPPLCTEVVEIDARAGPDGTTIVASEPADIVAAAIRLRKAGVESAAVVVLHGDRAGALERTVADAVSATGIASVSCSHDVVAEIGLVGRMETTIVDAYLTPLLRHYLADLGRELPGSTLRLMQSSGGLVDAAAFRGKNAVLSGPAGGVVACQHLARRYGPEVIGFDMGGTSTDVCRIAGELPRVYESEVAGVHLRAPMMAIHTVAAGGGSICRYDGHRFTVGPRSAGADPGPIGYGRGGTEITLTDVGIALGRIVGDRFPLALRTDAVVGAFDAIAAQLAGTAHARSAPEIAQGFFDVAIDAMAEAIRQVTVAQGHDVRTHTLIVFGGAGGQHACAIARRLGIKRLVVHPFAGVLSAYGMGLADVRHAVERDAGRRPLGEIGAQRLQPLFDALEARARAAVVDQGVDPTQVEIIPRIDLRYAGTQTSLTVPMGPTQTLRERFAAAHHGRFGYERPGHAIESVTARVEAVARSAPIPPPAIAQLPTIPPSEPTTRPLWVDGHRYEATVKAREGLTVGTRLRGPAVLLEDTGTIVVEPGWVARVDDHGEIVLSDEGEKRPDHLPRPTAVTGDPVRLQIMSNRLMSIATQMGTILRRTALSTNIRERLDFSCAVFDASGDLVANAPHMPVHLGAMSESVAAIARQHPHPQPGDVYATNDPAAGGSHLPDITVVSPVHIDDRVAFYVASRGHHADVGGITPGSMPPHAQALTEEGVVFRGDRIVAGGRFDFDTVRARLGAGPHPARRPADNVADLQAQVAAGRTGEALLRELCDQQGLAVVHAYMAHLHDHAEAVVRDAIRALPVTTASFSDLTDADQPIAVTIRRDDDRLTVDFTGTADQSDDNDNAPRAVTVAAVLYVLRAMATEPIPLNRGCLRPIELVIPPRSLLDPDPQRAVSSGNVETSQRIVDVLLGALDLQAASQGTMNNLTFGDDRFGYYETIGGGAGATATRDGQSGVHTHMTNTRITDPEVLEARYPVRLIRFGLRPGSGGRGRTRGGDGLCRELEFLEKMVVSIVSDRRVRPPFGLHGGEPGAVGRNRVGDRPLPGRATIEVAPGDRLTVETPGGGGYGPWRG